MKLASFNDGRIGIVNGDRLIDVTDLVNSEPGAWPPVAMNRLIARFDELKPQLDSLSRREAGVPLVSVRLQTPVPWPNKVVAYPANYNAHVAEMITGTGLISTFKADGQGFFLKSNSSLSGPADAIVLPALLDREVHHECELAIIIGRRARHVAREDAEQFIFGYACLIDAVVRGKEERVMRKSFDTFCPVGPWIVTRDEVADKTDIAMELSVNGELRQQANTRDLIVDIPEMIAMASSVMTLEPGDIIATGTPAGVGPMHAGDSVSISIAGIGAMTLDVVSDQQIGHKVWNKLG